VVAQADSEVVKVRLRGQRPADLAKIVNAVTAVFLEDVVNMDRVAALGMRQAIEKKYKENQAELRVLREQAIKLAAMVEGPDAVDAKWAERELDALSGELSGVRSALRTVTADIAVATSTGEPVDPKLEAKKKVLGEQASALVAEMDAIRTKARDLAQARVDLEARRRSVESLQRVTDQLGLQLEATAVELNAPLRVRLVEEATAPAGAGP
jgi:predicted  nucleic acid-binding Zn-ribbon protein